MTDLPATEDHGKFGGSGRADGVVQGPGPVERVGIQKAEGIERDVDRAGRQAFLITEVEEILA